MDCDWKKNRATTESRRSHLQKRFAYQRTNLDEREACWSEKRDRIFEIGDLTRPSKHGEVANKASRCLAEEWDWLEYGLFEAGRAGRPSHRHSVIGQKKPARGCCRRKA